MESNRKPMKKIHVFTIIFVILVLILTFFSKTLYNLNLPSVSYTQPKPGALKRVFNCETLAAAKTEFDLYAQVPQKVLKVQVREGDLVKKGQLLLRLDTSILENDLLHLELEKQQTKDAKKGSSSKAYQLALSSVEHRIKAKHAEIDGSAITAPADSYVTTLATKVGMTANPAEPLMTLGSVKNGLQVALNVTQKQATWFEKDDKVSVYIPMLNQTFDGLVSRIKSAGDGNMVALADISDPSGAIHAGQLAEVSFTKMSGDYLSLVPLSALHSDGDRNYIFKIETVPGALGDEYRLYKIYVRVLDQDDTNAALEGEIDSGDLIVTGSDKELYGGRIKLREE